MTYADLAEHKHLVLLGCGLTFFQAMTGISSVIFYSTTIFGFANFNDALLATVFVGLVNVSTTILAVVIIEKVNRKDLFQFGQVCMLVSLLTLVTVLLAGTSLGQHTQGVISVVAILIFVFGYSIGPGSCCWVILTELMITSVRAKAYGLFVSVHW